MNFQNTESYFEHMCRTCMCTSDGLGSIFDCASDNEEISIQEMLILITPQLCIQATDQLPKRICSCCVEKIISVHRFQQMCLYSDKRIRSLLSRIEGDFDNSGAFPTQVYETAIRSTSTEPDPLRDGSMEEIKTHLKLELQDDRCAITDDNRQDDKMSLNKTEITLRVGEQNNIYKNGHSEALFISNHSGNEYADILLKTKRRNLIEKRFACNQCSKRFTTSSHLKRHERNLHISSMDVEIKKDNESAITLCKQSHKTVLSGQIRKEHNCEHCNKKFKKLYSLKRHIRIHKDLFLPTDIIAQKQHEIARPYVCKYCKKAFQQSCTLKDHIRTHTGEQPFLCSECGRAFNSSSNMKQHLLRHTGVKRYECPDCPKKFPCLSDLASHKAVHKKVKPHVCDICGACFGKPYQLKKHKMYHNGEKPHKCEYCEMRFVCVDHMKRHMRTHTGEKPYKCKYCDRAFAQSNDLVKHLRSHLGENVYRCELCPRGFRLATELREHFPEHKNDHEQIKKLNGLTEEVKLKTDLMLELTEGNPRGDSEIK